MIPESDSTQETVTLREVTWETLDDILALKVSDNQRKFVADNARSIAQAHFCNRAWFRAIYADETPVGFIMLDDQPDKPEYFLWRLMIDHRYQGRGYGRKAVQLLIDYVETRPNATQLLTSIHEAEGDPGGFYRKLGFEFTGQYEEGEAMMRLKL
ncbi:MAG: acetyltransferase [Latescibacteria bacterium DG_63]|nr:MAG: acetyltransferase [Latescibacteria bacterium DG_63]